MIRRLDGWLFALLLLAATLALGYLAQRHHYASDWTAHQRASLAPESQAILRALHGPVEVVSYASPQGDLRQSIATYLERYQKLKPDLSLRFVDPQQDPGKMRELGISVDGTLVLHYQGREQRLEELSERALSNALERLLRGGERLVAFVTGDGERRADGQANADLGSFMAPLEKRGLRALPLNFSQVGQVPQHTDLVVLASPSLPLPAGAVKALGDYLADGGNLLWLTDPGSDLPNLQPLADQLDLHVLPGTLVDGAGAALGLRDPRMVAVGGYPANPITRGFVLQTLFPEVAALARTRQGDWSATPLLSSGPQSWTERQPIDPQQPSTIRFDASQGELQGPLDFAFSLSRLSPSPARNEQRVVVIGNGSFLANSFLGNGGNRALGERIIDWLLGDDALVALPPRGAPDRVMTLSQGSLDAVSLGFIVVLPALLLIAAGPLLWRRRRR